MSLKFSVVEVPESSENTEVGEICTALKENVGKGLLVECAEPGKPKRVPNTVRKSIRQALNARGWLLEYDFRTRVKGSQLTVWLEKRAEGAAPAAEEND